MYNKHTTQSYVQSGEAHNSDFGAQSSDTGRELFFILAIELNSMLVTGRLKTVDRFLSTIAFDIKILTN